MVSNVNNEQKSRVLPNMIGGAVVGGAAGYGVGKYLTTPHLDKEGKINDEFVRTVAKVEVEPEKKTLKELGETAKKADLAELFDGKKLKAVADDAVPKLKDKFKTAKSAIGEMTTKVGKKYAMYGAAALATVGLVKGIADKNKSDKA
ncbi:MAG: hypothetical protein R3Y28_06945 [Candidatus Gastranaerophilales bacterium]